MLQKKYILLSICSIFILFTMRVVAQSNLPQHEKSWREVDSLEKKGLYRSALKIVDEIMIKAQREKQSAVQVKSLIYQLKLREPIEENQFASAIQQIDSLKIVSDQPLKQILASVKAEMLWRYMQNNRYRFYQRSQMPTPELSVPTTWDLKTLLQQAMNEFTESVENAELLQKINLKEYAYILTDNEDENQETAPTLFDFLAHRALNFLQNTETSIWRAQDKFIIDDQRYFGTDQQFLNIKIISQDTLSEHLQYVKIMQQLVKFHQNDSIPIAKVRNNLMRLNFVYKNAQLTNENISKDDIFERELNSLRKKYAQQEIITEINAQLAQFYLQKKLKQHYNPQNERKNNDSTLIIAHNLCEDAITLFPNSLGAKQCKSVKNIIEEQTITGAIEQYLPQNKPILAQIKYKNVEQIQVVVYRQKIQNKKGWKEQLKNAIVVHKQTINLPITNDFLEHSTEIALPELSNGNYSVVYYLDSTKNDPETNNVVIIPIQVTDIAYVSNKIYDNKYGLWIVNRYTGEPIDKATVKVKRSDNYKFKNAVENTYTSDENGWLTIPTTKETQKMYHQEIKIIKENDTLEFNHGMYYSETDKETRFSDYLFADRAIYRPGQTVHFKGIRLKEKGKLREIVPYDRTEATLFNANGKEIAKLYLTSNEYGSFSDKFILPNSGITGQFVISTQFGQLFFKVEEYKRPTFKIEIQPIENAYKIGDNILIKATATAYADYAIYDAKVKYVVKRLPQYQIRPLHYVPYANAGNIVFQATTQTDQKGNFNIEFNTKKEQNEHENITYCYQIDIQVTDKNGETRTEQKIMWLSENDRFLIVKMDSIIDKKHKNQFEISVVNSEAQKLNAKGVINIYPIETAQQITRQRLWNKIDRPILKQQEFDSLFPYLEFEPKEKSERKILELIGQIHFDTEIDSIVTFQTKKYPAGEYRIETIIYDEKQREIKNIQFIKIIDTDATKNTFPDILQVYSPIKTAQPEDTISIYVSSSMKNQAVVMQIVANNEVVQYQQIRINKEQKKLSFVVNEEHRGGLIFMLYTVKYGVHYAQNVHIDVPYSNKELQVNFETFRNKLLPGDTEEWTLNISRPKKEKVFSELLLTMYDASLDEFRKNQFYFSPFRTNNYTPYIYYSFGLAHEFIFRNHNPQLNAWTPTPMPTLNNFGYSMLSTFGYMKRMSAQAKMQRNAYNSSLAIESVQEESAQIDSEINDANYAPLPSSDVVDDLEKIDRKTDIEYLPIRKNFNETAFFYPHLNSDENGNVLIKFTAPEAITRWNILGIAHTKDLKSATLLKEIITQKDVMIQAHVPRFVRFGDEVFITAKVSNLTDKKLNGTATIQLTDAKDKRVVNTEFQLVENAKILQINEKSNEIVSWKIVVPATINLLAIQVRFQSDKHTDGEEQIIPILSNKMLVTETMPITMNKKGSKTFEFKQLLEKSNSKTREDYAVTFEYSTDPKWYVLQSLPYLMEQQQVNTQEIFERFYANYLSTYLIKSFPRIKNVIDEWKKFEPQMFLSELEKNQELKTIILEETPWVMEAENETEQRKRISLLFDATKVNEELNENIQKLGKLQSQDGGFSWFEGMKSNTYITTYIVSGIGRLVDMGAVNLNDNEHLLVITKRALNYLDNQLIKKYEEIKKDGKKLKDASNITSWSDYWYARSFFLKIDMSPNIHEAFEYLQKIIKAQLTTDFLSFSLKTQTKIALSLNRIGDTNTAKNIMQAILELAIVSEEQGMYWKQNKANFIRNEDPIETQSLIIEAFYKILNDKQHANLAKIYLLSQKHTTKWHNSIATANACYALLLCENNVDKANQQLTISVGKEEIPLTEHMKIRWEKEKIYPELATANIKQVDDHFSYGALYLQFFETIDKIPTHATNLSLKKQLFVVNNTLSGEQLKEINDGDSLLLGDIIRIRLTIYTDRDLNFVHFKDDRTAGGENVLQLSQYKWQDGVGYYQNPRDVSMNFFFDGLPKGTYVLEYDIRATHLGNFSSGLAQIQCMYAPEYRSHTQIGRIKIIENK